MYLKVTKKGTEPGYYCDGEYGIRIESVVVVREVQTANNFGGKGFLGFERATMVSFFFLSHVLWAP
jgi:Xaa-Pro aminopeptidase